MNKKIWYLLILVVFIAGCASQQANYDSEHYDSIYKDIQKKLVYEKVDEKKDYILTIYDFNASVKIKFMKEKKDTSILISGISNPSDAYYSLKEGGEAKLSFNACTLSYRKLKEETDCSPEKIDRIKKDKETYVAYFSKYNLTGKGILMYCDEYVNEHKDSAVELDPNFP